MFVTLCSRLSSLYKMTAPTGRVLVQIQNASQSHPQPAEFYQSILDSLGSCQDTMEVYARLVGDHFVISEMKHDPDEHPVKIKRPSFCPIHHLTPSLIETLPPEIRTRGIDVGMATILETCDGKVLLTRRAQHLRTFPGVWVPPGGHVEQNETLHEAGLRELQEETGLVVKAEQCHKGQIPILALWESVFPPMLSVGTPKRHHAVSYMYAKLKPPLSAAEMQSRLRCDPQEVGAAAWLDREFIKAIVSTSDEDDTDAQSVEHLPETFQATVLSLDGSCTMQALPTKVLLQRATGQEVDVERVSTGTKFILSEWLKYTS